MATPPSYGVAWSDVGLPFDTSALPVTGGRLSQTDLAGYIEAAGVTLTGLLNRAGISPSALTTNQLLQVQKDIIPYAQMEALFKVGNTGPAYTQARARWETVLAKWSSATSTTPDAPSTALNNVPRDACCDNAQRYGWRNRNFRF